MRERERADPVERLFVGDVSVDDQCVPASCQHVGPDDGDVVPAAVVDARRRVDDDRARSVARVEHVPRSSVHQLHRQEVAIDHARAAVDQQPVQLQRTNLTRRHRHNCLDSPV